MIKKEVKIEDCKISQYETVYTIRVTITAEKEFLDVIRNLQQTLKVNEEEEAQRHAEAVQDLINDGILAQQELEDHCDDIDIYGDYDIF
jgi:hypothetical protein